MVSAVCVLHALVHNSGKMSVRDLRMAARAAASALKTVRLVTCDLRCIQLRTGDMKLAQTNSE